MKTQHLFLRYFLILITFGCTTHLAAQPGETFIKVNVAPDRLDWLYKAGEPVTFDISVTKNDVCLKNIEVRYELSEDMMDPLKKETVTLKDGRLSVNAGSLKKPGFLRCSVFVMYDGKEYVGRATAGFDPEKIQPTVGYPSDFVSFWEAAISENAKIPMAPVVTLLPERCTDKVNVYHVGIQNYRLGSRIYGILCVPKAPGKYPALLKVPGAGIRPYSGDPGFAAEGVITFEIGIHGIPVNLPAGVYNDLNNGALNNYPVFNMDNKDQYFYKRVYLGCVRSVDFIYSLPEFDGTNLVVTGGSQGGALSIITAGLDARVKGLAAYYPALCDMTGYLYGRAGGWPHAFRNVDKNDKVTARKIETIAYYDVVNFARQIKVPGFYSFGYNDMVCPPTSMYSAFNVISAPKTMFIVEEIAHWTYPEQYVKARKWISAQLK
ncbi:MAG: acetylxylan esterase [Dysgonamonadaceae bacterium]|jgi:cephalosporin-C deacetylase-like acetyl esterase|nr:acetylxylan esterase [Dysgonamonadaceae bacterium]